MSEYVGALEFMKFTEKHWFLIGLILIIVCLSIAFMDLQISYPSQEPSGLELDTIDIALITQDLNQSTKEDFNSSNMFVVLGYLAQNSNN